MKVIKLIPWAFWNVVYLIKREPKSLDQLILKIQRTRYPFWKFKPYMYHNDAGKQWEIYFENDADHVRTMTIPVEAHIGRESGKIIGITIWDETLKNESI